MSEQADEGQSAPEQLSGAAYVGTALGLFVLATASLLLSRLHWPIGGLIVAVAIAAFKALLVLFFFMHLAEQRFSNRLTVLVSVGFVALLVGLTAADVASRHTFAARPAPPAGDPFYVR